MKPVYHAHCSLCMITVNFWKNPPSCRLGRALIRSAVSLGSAVAAHLLRVLPSGQYSLEPSDPRRSSIRIPSMSTATLSRCRLSSRYAGLTERTTLLIKQIFQINSKIAISYNYS